MRLVIHVDDVPYTSIREKYPDAPKGEEVYFKDLTKISGAQDLSVGIGWQKPGEVHKAHHHPDASEFYYILEGSGEITVGGSTVQVKPGIFCYIPVNVSHKVINNTNETLVLLYGYNRGTHQTIWDE